ncbi:hypothetical protein AN216_04225 [Streptomyces oceani]|uniref:Uncharacterized protein n=1 Tax=Streptomyces oceani TaxID=1075402 RepID=A0A1E7KMQ7_9ACTN|nr:hypothetical protein AN216_04225 [Streptomyces oceani]
MSSSGLIYAVIVGAWAAYLVPMWLRRQDELNEARPTERFSTAIRLLSGKAAMERRYAKEADRRTSDAESDSEPEAAEGDVGPAGDDRGARDAPDESTEDPVDVRAFADPKTMVGAAPRGEDDGRESAAPELAAGARPQRAGAGRGTADTPPDGPEWDKAERSKAARGNTERNKAERGKRARVLARRRRTTMALFLAFTCGAIIAAVGGVAFLWAPAAPAALLSAYIVHLRIQERRRFVVTMDRRKAEEAARRLRAQRVRPVAADPTTGGSRTADATGAGEPRWEPESTQAHAVAGTSEPAADRRAPSADRRALVERTDHAEWVDQQRGRVREQSEGEEWDPVPVPLPTYVSAPVAPRTARGVDLDAPDTWSSARSSTAGAGGPAPEPGTSRTAEPPSGQRPADVRGQRGPEAKDGTEAATPERGRTPLFDQYADEDRPRAVNE